MAGYLNQAEATSQAIDADGWLYTRRRVCGRRWNFFIVDRLKEFIKYKGFRSPGSSRRYCSRTIGGRRRGDPVADDEAGEFQALHGTRR